MPRRKKIIGNLKQFQKEGDTPIASTSSQGDGDTVNNEAEKDAVISVPYVETVSLSMETSEMTFLPMNFHWQEIVCRRLGIDDIVCVEYVGIGNKLFGEMIIRQIKPDGNCLFRCFSVVLTGTEENHELVRTLVVEHLLENRDAALEKFEFHSEIDSRSRRYAAARKKAFDEHLENMAIPGPNHKHWGTMVEVIGAASLFQTDIFIYQDFGGNSDSGPQLAWQTYSSRLLRPAIDAAPQDQSNAIHSNIYIKNITNTHFELIVGILSEQEIQMNIVGHCQDAPNCSSHQSDVDAVNFNMCRSCGKTFKRLNSHLSRAPLCKHVHESLVDIDDRRSYNKRKQSEYREQESDEKRAKRLRLHIEYNQAHNANIVKKQSFYDLTNKQKICEKQSVYNRTNKEKVREKQAVYNRTNKEKVREKQSVYNSTNKEKVREKQSVYNSTNKEKVREKQAVYDRTNQQKVREKQSVYNSTNKEKVREKQAVYDRTNKEIVREKQTVYNQCNQKEIGKKSITRQHIKKKNTQEEDRVKRFQKDVKFGPIFPCCICHRNLYQVGVKKLTDHNRNTLSKDVFQKCYSPLPHDDQYICHTCCSHLTKGNIPPMSVTNGLFLDEIPEELKLSEIGQVLIAKAILFFKLFKLPKSRWSAVRDKTVHVPITDEDILNTLSNLSSLPRLPDEAGLVPVKLKRKVEYKNYLLESYVDPAKLVEAVKVLKQLCHPGYANIKIRDYAQKSKSGHPNDTRETVPVEELPHCSSTKAQTDGQNVNGIGTDDDNNDDEDEIDNIRKYQSDDLSTVMSNDHPEIQMNVEVQNRNSNSVSVAPGQGKIPTNLMREENWDVDSFPTLYPTGQYGLNFPRTIKLSPWKYFCQRLYNVDKRFASSNPFVFASLYYMERHAIEQQINISYLKGNVSASGELTNIEDAFSVLDKIPGSPRYWKAQRNIMFAKLENFGPFLFFYTLSCADRRWTENFTSVFAQMNRKVKYREENGTEKIYIDDVPLDDVLLHENMHELLKENIDVVARNFNQRSKAFTKNIMLGANNPMYTEYYNQRVEFQARGAGHNHGVLWPRFKDLEKDFPGLQEALATLRRNELLSNSQQKVVTEMVDAFITCSLDNNLRPIVEQVQVHKHSQTCRKYGTVCRFGFPRFPSDRTIIAQTMRLENYDSETHMEKEKARHKEVLSSVKETLQKLIENDMLDQSTLGEVLAASEVSSEDYYKALSISDKGTTIILRRNVSELYVNNYNSEWLRAWNANMDLQVCLDYYAVLTYITDYYMKDDSGTMQFLLDATKEYGGRNVKDKMKYLANVFLTHRQKGKFEAFYCIDPSLHLTESNIKSLYVDTNLPENRRKFLMKLSDDDGDDDHIDEGHEMNPVDDDEEIVETVTETRQRRTVTIPGKKGRYVQKSLSLHEKYERRPSALEKISFAQFCIVFDACQQPKNKRMVDGVYGKSEKLIVTADPSVCENLPELIQLGDNVFMRLRKKPAAIRLHKVRQDKEPHQFAYAELLLYHPWSTEEECHPDDEDKCLRKYRENLTEIQTVKNILFPHRNNVEDARTFMESITDPRPNHIGDILDAANEQEQEELKAQGEEIDEEWMVLSKTAMEEIRSILARCTVALMYLTKIE